MLKKLSINNFALIDELVFEPQKGFNVVTGETGAGKTIIFDALALVLGNRADNLSLLNENSKCIIEGEFKLHSKSFTTFFEKNDFDFEELTVIRREITPSGKSRSFINDTPASLNLVKELCSSLVEIHGQNDTLEIFKANKQLALLDGFADNTLLLKEYRKTFLELSGLRKNHEILVKQRKEANSQKDYFTFLLDELLLFEPELKDDLLQEELERLSNAEELNNLGLDFVHRAIEHDQSIYNQLTELEKSIQKMDSFFPLNNFLERFKQIIIELQDLGKVVEAAQLLVDQNALLEIESRYSKYNDLLLKHNLSNAEDLVNKKNELSVQVELTLELDHEIAELKNVISNSEKSLIVKAEVLSSKRLNASRKLEDKIVQHLKEMEMPHAKIEVRIQQQTELNDNGIDHIETWFTANKSRPLMPLRKVASGGESSRLALVLKAIVNQQKGTLIFDEIDTGVSGKVAQKVGALLNQMGKNQQVISITHSPQVASSAKTHFYVYKQDELHPYTRIKLLNTENKVTVIAEMLSGTNVTNSAIANAKSLIKSTLTS